MPGPLSSGASSTTSWPTTSCFRRPWRLAADIVSSDQRAVRAILATYEEASRVPGAEAWDVEARAAAEFQRGGVDPDDIERRRQGVVDRGRSQV